MEGSKTSKIITSGDNGGSNKVVIIILTLVVLVAIASAAFFYSKYQSIKKNPNQESTQQTNSLVNTVSKLITLPSDETPTVATVSDKSKLENQPFFKNAQNGDKLLIYTNAKQAIVYRPSTNKIINVGPIAIDASSAGTTTTPTPTPSTRR